MFPSIRQGMIHALVVVLSLSLSAIEAANAYPDQPIKIIVTFPPGGSADIVIRALQPALAETLQQPIVIETGRARAAISASGPWRRQSLMATRSAWPRPAC